MALDQDTFQIEYAFSPSLDAEERLDQAYDLILELILASHQIPEEGAVDVPATVTDAGEIIQASLERESRQLGASHAR